jgi:competence ComEA-like helix-hairpin-helix protein
MEKLNLNQATVEDLEKIPGVTRTLSRRIVAERERLGAFSNVGDLKNVAGMTADLLEVMRENVFVDPAAVTPKPKLVTGVLDPQGQNRGRYRGYRVSAEFVVLTPVAGTEESISTPSAASNDTTPDGLATLTLPDARRIQGNVTFVVRAPDGEVVLRVEKKAADVGDKAELAVKPRELPVTQPAEDPGFEKPKKLRGRVIDKEGRGQIAGKQVVIWTAKAANPQDADFAAVMATTTDATGYFSGPYPLGQFLAAHATVALDPTQAVPIRLNDGAMPGDVILVVEAPRKPKDLEAECGCKSADGLTLRNPDAGDLVNGTYTSDIGQGSCVDFTRPDRTLQEFAFSYVVRTTEPSVKGLTLAEPKRIPPGLVNEIVKLSQLTAMTATLDTTAATGASAPVSMRANTALAVEGLELHADLWRKAVSNPEKASATSILDVAKASKYLDIVHALDMSLSGAADRTRLSCRNAMDWDHDPTVYQACTIAHGHILNFKQEWIADGYSMGRLLYSLPLAPGQKKQIAVLDWERRETAIRQEALEETESLQATLSRDRDIGEMVNSVLTESSRGGSRASSSSVAGGVGLGFLAGPVGGLLGIGGGASSAGSTAWQNSSRNVAADSLQTLRDRTSQAAAAMRAQRSTVIQTISQGERVAVTTESVANYNHCHAMTIEYFEVLRHLIVRQRLTDVQECLFVPLQISRFDRAKALRWRTTLKPIMPERALRAGFDALERIDNNYAGSDMPLGAYAEERLDYLEGELTIRFQLARPRDDQDDFHAPSWQWMGLLLPMINPQELYKNFLKGQAFKDRIFLEQLGPRIARAFVDLMKIAWVDSANVEHSLPIDTTLLSNFANDTGLAVSIRLSGGLPPVARKDIKFIKISEFAFPGIPFLNVLPANSRVIVDAGRMSYRTKYSSGDLFQSGRIANDLTGSDAVRIYTPLTQQEMRNPREEDKELTRRLLDHLNENLERYHHALWWRMSPDRRYMLIDGFEAPNSGGRSVASVVDNTLIGIVGNSLVMPVSRGFHLDPTFNQDLENPIDLLEHYHPNTPIEPLRVAIPTRGVYAEAVMGACNSCERKEEERFWRWEESPIPDNPPAIQPVSTESRQTPAPDLTAKDFPAPIVAMQAVPAAPDPTGLGAALNLLGQSGLFKDITGLEGSQKNAAAALQSAFDTAQFFGGKAADLALQGRMAKDIDKTMRTIQAAKADGLLTDAQAQELTKNAISGMIGAGTKPEEGDKLTSVPEVKEAIQKASDAPGGEIAMSRATAGGRENVEVKIPGADAGRSWIIEPADKKAWAAARAFHPGADGGDKTGTTKLTVRTRPVPEGGSVRWSVPPNQAGRYTLKGGASVQSGLTAEITGLQPGISAIDFDVLDADGKSVESQKYPLSIPQFVSVGEDGTFTTTLQGYGLVDFEITQVLTEAREVCNAVLKDANMRTVWLVLGETLPPHLASGAGNAMVTKADFKDAVAGGGLYGRCFPPFAPNIFNEKIEVYAKGFQEAVSGNANEHVDEVTNEIVRILVNSGPISSVEKDLGIHVLGRLYGETLAHEIGHSLIGTTLTSAPHNDHNAGPGNAGDLMNRGVDRSFGARTGCSLNGGQVTQPLVDNLSLLPGIPAINVPTGKARAEIDAHFPVPPVFK